MTHPLDIYNKFRNLRLGQKFFLSLFGITLVPLLTVSIINFYNSKSAIENKTKDALQALNNSRASHINFLIRLRQEQAKEIAGIFLTRQLAMGGETPQWLIHKMQGQVEFIFRELNLTPQSAYQDIDKPTDIESIGFVDVNGVVIVNTDKKWIGQSVPQHYLRSVLSYGTYFAGLEQDSQTGEGHLIILDEIRNWESGKSVGAILFKVNAKTLNDITADREGLGKTGESYLVDRRLRMITDSRFVKNAALNQRVDTQPAKACFQGGPMPTFYISYKGTYVLGMHKYLPDQDWCLISEIDVSEAFAIIECLRRRVIAIVLLVIVLILYISRGMNLIFIKPIIDLRNASDKVAGGDFDTKVLVASQDEIGQLSGAFNQMTEHLRRDKEILEQQKKDLEKVNKELDSFVYTASHDLRAPLRGIAAFADFLREDYDDKLNAKGKDYLKEIRDGANRLNRLIEDLLTLSRISRIKNPYERVNILELVAEILERIKFDITDNDVEMRVDKDLPVIVCDRIKIGEAFFNLINNAIKFSSKENSGRPKVEIGYNSLEKYHQFHIRDNGLGIDPQFHERIFEVFQRLHKSTDYEGTGAGLSIVKNIVEQHDGKVWVESRLGEGACFFFTILKDLQPRKEG